MGRASRLKKIRRIQDVDSGKKRDIRWALRQVEWLGIIAGVFFIFFGIVLIVDGMEAYKDGATIPFRAAFLTGPQAIFVGFLIAILGIFACGYELYKLKKRIKNNSNNALNSDGLKRG